MTALPSRSRPGGRREPLPDVLRLVGDTPLVRVRIFERDFPQLEVHAKAEWMNPGGSVKDRPALRMILEAEARGELVPGRTIIDSTSGNTGIAYALVGAALGHRVRLVMPANVSEERKHLVRAYGAEVHYSDPLEGSDGAILECRRLVSESPGQYYWPDQYSNPDNPLAHYHGTAVEILRDLPGRPAHFVAGLGTSGTLVGTGRRLREEVPGIQVTAVMPDSGFHGIEGLKHMPSAIVPPIYDRAVHHQLMEVTTEEAYLLARTVAREEGLLVGHSSGAALAGVRRLAENGATGICVTVLPDGGDRYLSTGLYGSA
ncbi:MAG: PLP-dependent cysteine synthase family protein [Candidatus Dormibacteria bacterium]